MGWNAVSQLLLSTEDSIENIDQNATCTMGSTDTASFKILASF